MNKVKNPGFKPSFGKDQNYKGYTIRGWTSPAQKKFYKEQSYKIKNGIIVEVGVYGGMSLLSIIDICRENNNTIYGIDPWDKTTIANGEELSGKNLELLRANLKKVRLQLQIIVSELKYSHVKLVQDFSVNAAKQFDDGTVDLVFLDGDHSYDAVYADLKAWLPKLKKNGCMWGDDLGWVSVRTALDEFCRDNNLTYSQDTRNWYLDKRMPIK